MIIKEREFKACGTCGHREVKNEAEYGCDCCGKPTTEEQDHLNATVFSNTDNKTYDLNFCSWRCALQKLATVETDYFISLPYLHFDAGQGVSAKAFFDAVRAFKSPEAGRGDNNAAAELAGVST